MRWLTRLRIAPLVAAGTMLLAGPGLVSTVVAQRGGHGGGHHGTGGEQRTTGNDPAAPGHQPAVPLRGSATTFGAVPAFPLPRGARLPEPSGRSNRGSRRSGVILPTLGYYGGVYPYDPGAVSPPPGVSRSTVGVYPPQEVPPPYPPAEPTGWLELPVAPAEAQVYIDGFYAGTVADFSRAGGLPAEAGPHHIEIRAQGYETANFDVRLAPNQTVAYREDLRPLNGVPQSRTAPARKAPAATTFYVIADCYAGNVPPSQATLRPGCDPSQVKTVVIQR
jgi:hypothetical protein